MARPRKVKPVEAPVAATTEISNAPVLNYGAMASGERVKATMAPAQKDLDHPRLKEWIPGKEDVYLLYVDDIGCVIADFSKCLGSHYYELETFQIKKKHYKERMDDVVFHTNYYIKFYDKEKQFFISLMTIKHLIDMDPNMSQAVFKDYIISRIVTNEFVANMKKMARDLQVVNINTDLEGKYKTTPKITNEHARNILALSFALRAVLPLCIHFSNINNTIVANRDYIKCFDKIFMAILHRFEENDVPIYVPLCKFVGYRIKRAYQADAMIWDKKKQLYGTTYESEFQNLIHEVILVKSLYKIAYDRSVVSYIDGVVTNSYNHFRFENFKFKPVEIEADTGGGDSDDYLTHAESIEMSMYRIDESNQIINEVNNDEVMQQIRKTFTDFGITISDDELNFYMENMRFNHVTEWLIHAFFSRYFHNSQSVITIKKNDAITLAVYLKKYLQAVGMIILPQLCTATMRGKFKENMIKNSKFTEKFQTSDVYQQIVKTKFRYVSAINPKEDILIKRLSTIINSDFTFVDTDPEINGMVVTDIPNDTIIDEYLRFLSII